MLDSLTKIFSVATLGFLFLMALFNIGYFYAIGFHFIGVMDISNVVYTFGLVLIFAMLYIAVGQVVWVVSDGLAKVGSKVIWPKLGNKGKLIIAICAVVLVSVAITFLFRPTANEKLIGLTTAGLVAPLIGFLVLMVLFQRWKAQRKFEGTTAAIAGIMIALGTFLLGVAVAHQQMAGAQGTYDIVTKSGTFVDARVLRSSSSGFIFLMKVAFFSFRLRSSHLIRRNSLDRPVGRL